MKKVNIDSDHFRSVLICAVRYCLGRRTYMPEVVTDWIMSQCSGTLTKKDIYVMRRDIDEYRQRGALGMQCDVETWEGFDAWLRTEEENGKNK